MLRFQKSVFFKQLLLVIIFLLGVRSSSADDFSELLKPVMQEHCVGCHGRQQLQGDVNLLAVQSAELLRESPELLQKLLGVLQDNLMPPEDQPPLDPSTRQRMLVYLKTLFDDSIVATKRPLRTPIRRMNRFQYNNAVQDLFELDVVVFTLPERMLREHGDYFRPKTGEMPATLRAGSRPLGKSQLIERRLAGVVSFPQDLRAEHGFDNQADHLTLSPLLLESFLRLGQSIVASPDFNEHTCGIWQRFFAMPQDSSEGLGAIIRNRLQRFLRRAFRRPVETAVLDRYCRHVEAQVEAGATFTAAMKSAAAAALSSPRFFYLYDVGKRTTAPADSHASKTKSASDDFDLASRLSFFLWSSIPDEELLDLAYQGKLHQPSILAAQVERLLRDKRLKRFCDSFPAQWLQLERIVSSTPDPEKYPQFYFGKYRASMHMMLEPLLLFETVLVEDRSILQFIDSDFSYRSNLLDAWYRDGTQGRAGSPVQIQFQRVPITDRRQGGVITNAAVMTMTSNDLRTKPITRGAWMASVILNDPPEPPPADVPPLPDVPSEEEARLTLRERFVAHRQRADCAGCHRKIDPLGFALENYDAAGIWRDTYENGKPVDPSGTLFGKHQFRDIIEFKDGLLAEPHRFTRALASHLLSFALGREMRVEDSSALDQIVRETAAADYRFQALIQQIVLSDAFTP